MTEALHEVSLNGPQRCRSTVHCPASVSKNATRTRGTFDLVLKRLRDIDSAVRDHRSAGVENLFSASSPRLLNTTRKIINLRNGKYSNSSQETM